MLNDELWKATSSLTFSVHRLAFSVLPRCPASRLVRRARRAGRRAAVSRKRGSWKDVPRQRLLEVARRYELFDGLSPINSQNRALLTALVDLLNAQGPQLPVYWGNRNWHPLLADTIRQMAEDGVERALALVTSAFGSYPGCRQYLEDIERPGGVGPAAPQVQKLRLFYNHPGFIEAMAGRVAAALGEIPAERRCCQADLYRPQHPGRDGRAIAV